MTANVIAMPLPVGGGEPTVYLVQSEKGGPIKIGFTRGPVEWRLAQLQCGNPYRLRALFVIPGGTDTERALHARFAATRLTGEWFEADADLLGFVLERAGLPALALAVGEHTDPRAVAEAIRRWATPEWWVEFTEAVQGMAPAQSDTEDAA